MSLFRILENVRPFRSSRFVFVKSSAYCSFARSHSPIYIPVSSSSVPVLVISVSDLHSIVGLGQRRESAFLNGKVVPFFPSKSLAYQGSAFSNIMARILNNLADMPADFPTHYEVTMTCDNSTPFC